MSRLEQKFTKLKESNKTAFIPYIMAGDPDYKTTLDLMHHLVDAAHVDIIELGLAFTDPMADGPAIQDAGTRALANGARLTKTLELAKEFRKKNDHTPIVLMGYFNPIHKFGVSDFFAAAQNAGIDGLLVADLPVEEDNGFTAQAAKHNINIIQLITPKTPETRLEKILEHASGFIYYVSVAGTTGGASGDIQQIENNIKTIKKHTALPICIGFGIKSPETAAEMAKIADGVIVGSAIVKKVEENLENNMATPKLVENVSGFVKTLSSATHQ